MTGDDPDALIVIPEARNRRCLKSSKTIGAFIATASNGGASASTAATARPGIAESTGVRAKRNSNAKLWASPYAAAPVGSWAWLVRACRRSGRFQLGTFANACIMMFRRGRSAVGPEADVRIPLGMFDSVKFIFHTIGQTGYIFAVSRRLVRFVSCFTSLISRRSVSFRRFPSLFDQAKINPDTKSFLDSNPHTFVDSYSK
jgi:hypothetical protein